MNRLHFEIHLKVLQSFLVADCTGMSLLNNALRFFENYSSTEKYFKQKYDSEWI